MTGATIWKGYIHFGGTDIGVKLHSAVREERVQFHLLHAPDRERLRQQMICAYDKQPVAAQETVKGFEVEAGKYLIVDPGELEHIVPEAGRMIEIHEFVKTSQVDSLFIDRLYNLEPDWSSQQGKGYRELVRALTEMGLAGICTWTMRKRSYFGALQASGTTLRLSTLRYADEVVAAASLGLKSVPLSEKELSIGGELIEKLTEPFEPRKFANDHEQKLRELIEKKARGENIAILPPRKLRPTEPEELLQALEESLKKAA